MSSTGLSLFFNLELCCLKFLTFFFIFMLTFVLCNGINLCLCLRTLPDLVFLQSLLVICQKKKGGGYFVAKRIFKSGPETW